MVKVAVIGSFRKHYAAVLEAIRTFGDSGWTVTSPSGSDVLDSEIEFVRFESDDPVLSDAEVQSVTLERIFSADVTYVVAPEGYVGRTTCYEIGRLIQAQRPVYMSHRPDDLPIRVAERFVLSPADLVGTVNGGGEFETMHEVGDDLIAQTERRMLA